jgi:hypothetical protein
MSQRCPNCKTELPEGANFCSGCGYPISQMNLLASPPQREWFPASSQLKRNAPQSLIGTFEMWSGVAAMLAGILLLAPYYYWFSQEFLEMYH